MVRKLTLIALAASCGFFICCQSQTKSASINTGTQTLQGVFSNACSGDASFINQIWGGVLNGYPFVDFTVQNSQGSFDATFNTLSNTAAVTTTAYDQTGMAYGTTFSVAARCIDSACSQIAVQIDGSAGHEEVLLQNSGGSYQVNTTCGGGTVNSYTAPLNTTTQPPYTGAAI